MSRRTLFLLLSFCVVSMPVVPLAAQDTSTEPPISQMSAPELLHCATKETCDATDWDVANELRRRLSVQRLTEMYPTQSANLNKVIVYALYTAKGRDVEAVMRDAAFLNLRSGQTGEDNHYFSLEYLAKLCDQHALKELNRPANYKNGYPISCLQWQTTLATFGECGYRPAIPLLVGNLDDACVNNITAAQGSLRKLMPKSKCWKKASAEDDFQAEASCYLREYRTSDQQ